MFLLVAISATIMHSEGFSPRASRIGSVCRTSESGRVTSNGRLLPLNTNPRKIDVGEESIARFGKVRVMVLVELWMFPGSLCKERFLHKLYLLLLLCICSPVVSD